MLILTLLVCPKNPATVDGAVYGIPEIVWEGCNKVTFVKPDDWNAFVPILVTERGIVIDDNAMHNRNAELPMLITELGIIIVDKTGHPKNALIPILVTEFGIVTDVNVSHAWNTLVPMLVNDGLVGSITDTKESQFLNAFVPILVTELGIVIDVEIDGSLKQFWNAFAPILISVEVGVNVSDVELVPPKNALAPILVTVLPIVILDICATFWIGDVVDAGKGRAPLVIVV